MFLKKRIKMNSDKIASILKTIPANPGVYQYFDEKGEVIYVGKAKNLKRRVSSYFNKHQTGKVRLLVSRIADIRFTIVDSESEALLLENNFIKQYKPRYNVLLKDDKTYPWICVKNERFPRVFLTRNKVENGSLYFGPYPSVMMVRNLLEVIRHLYPVRTCQLKLTEEKIRNGSFRPCLEYHIGNCLAPCNGSICEEDYNAMIINIKSILRGNVSCVLKDLKNQMMYHASLMEFEKAQIFKDKYDMLKNYHSKSLVCSNTPYDVEVFSFDDAESYFYVNYMKVVEGAVVQSHSFEIKRKLEETVEELLSYSVIAIRERFESNTEEVIVPVPLDMENDDFRLVVPQKGEKLNLLQLSQRNVKQYRADVEKLRALTDPDRYNTQLLNKMKEDLRMNELPEVIECFDNSNFQGDYPVASMVQFVNAKPNKKGYRHFNIKTVEGPDDFHSMEEIIYRRYKRLLDEKKPLPQLIIVDGGKGQLSAALRSLEKLGLRGKITIIGIAKRLEEIYYPGDSIPLYIDKRSGTLKVIQHLRDEAHRFGITFHRNKFAKGFIKSELDDIKGIGKQTIEKLLLHFKSVKAIKESSFDDLAAVIGKAKAKIVFDTFNRRKTSENL